MAREHFVWSGDSFKPAHEVHAIRSAEARKKRSALAAPNLFRDEHWPKGLECHADGKTYYNKSDYYRAVKAAGCEILGSKEKLAPRPAPLKPKLTDAMRREIRQKVQALDSPTRKLVERRRKRNA